jgi:hypothetical protein
MSVKGSTLLLDKQNKNQSVKTKTVCNEELVKALESVIPNAKVITKDGNLHRLEIGEVAIVVASYSIDVTIIERPVVHTVTFKIGDAEFSKEFKTEQEANAFRAQVDTTAPHAEIKQEEKLSEDIPF